MKINCKKCGYDSDESKIDLHHLFPKYLGGTDRDGRQYLCQDCHKELHKYIVMLTNNWLNNWQINTLKERNK